jgi:hypothetical protein
MQPRAFAARGDWLAPAAPVTVATASAPAAAARTSAVVNRRAMPRFMMTSFTPFAGYDVDRGLEVAVVTDIQKTPLRARKRQVTGNR